MASSSRSGVQAPSFANRAERHSGAAMKQFTHTRPIELLSIASLRPYPGNARTHSKKQIRQIADSIRRFGFTNPVLIGDDGEIIAGHGRVEAAKLFGLESVPTIRLVSPQCRRAARLRARRQQAGAERRLGP